MWILRLLTLATMALTISSFVDAATVVPVGPFRSVALNHGGHVVIRHGAVQSVTIVEGDTRCFRIRVADGERLIIERNGHECSRKARAEVEVVTPHLSSVAVSNGGMLRVLGAFPVQESIDAAVEQGGTIDIRSIAADAVSASVYSGGAIFTTSRRTLTASVDSGGVITYWGDVDNVRKSVRHGGVVARGKSDDAAKPVSDFGAKVPPLPPVPLVSTSNF